jgi:hypothetical protein
MVAREPERPRRQTTRLGRLLIATFAFLCAWLLAAELEVLGAPGWTMLTCGAVIVISIIVIIVTLHLWTQGGDGGESDPGRRDDHGRGGPRRPRPAPQPVGDGGDPSWWPEFERQLALYAAERDGGTRRSPGLPVRTGVESR